MDAPLKIERYKGIAEYVGLKTGLSVSENAARKWASRPVDPLPLDRFSGRIAANRDELDAWIARQRGAGRRRAGIARSQAQRPVVALAAVARNGAPMLARNGRSE
jgi:hypothetical protein